MEFDPSVALWRQEAGALVDAAASAGGRDGARLVLVTTPREVLEFDSQARKCVNHWSVRGAGASAGPSLALGAVRHPASRVLFGVQAARKAGGKKSAAAAAGEAVVCWRNSDQDASKWKRAPLAAAAGAHAVLVHPQLAEEAVVVFADGAFAAFDENLTRVLDVVPEAEDAAARVVWAALHSDHPRNPMKGKLFLSIVAQRAADGRFELAVHQILAKKAGKSASVSAVQSLRHSIAAADGDVLSACAFHAETFSYSLVWASGKWEALRLGVRNAASPRFSLFVASTQQLATLGATAASDKAGNKKRKLITANGASDASAPLVACNVGAFSYLVVASTQTPNELTGWDAKFAVPVASTTVEAASTDAEEQSLKITSKPSATGKLLALRTSLQGEMVLAVYERAVFLVTVKNKHSTLSSVLGAGVSTAVAQPTPMLPESLTPKWWSDVATDEKLALLTDVDAWKTNVVETSATAKEQKLVAELADPLVTRTAADFLKKYKEAKTSAGDHKLSFRVAMTVAQRCVASPDLALWTPLREVISTKCVSARALPALLPTLARHHQLSLLELAISHLTDMDERAIVRLLRFFIRLRARSTDSEGAAKPSKAKKRKAAGSKAEEASISSDEAERFIVSLLALPANSVFLHHAIRELQLHEVLYLLTVCKKYAFAGTLLDHETDKKKRVGKDKGKTKVAAVTPTFAPFVGNEADAARLSSEQLCLWIGALIDAHLAQLVMAAGSNPAVAAGVERLGELVDAQLRSCDQFESVQSVLSNFLSARVRLPQAHGVPEYCIEELRI